MTRKCILFLLAVALILSVGSIPVQNSAAKSPLNRHIPLIAIDRTNADPNFDPKSNFSDELLKAIESGGAETLLQYNQATGETTIEKAFSDMTSEFNSIRETPPYIPEGSAAAAPIESDESARKH